MPMLVESKDENTVLKNNFYKMYIRGNTDIWNLQLFSVPQNKAFNKPLRSINTAFKGRMNSKLGPRCIGQTLG